MLMSKTILPLCALMLAALFPVFNATADPPTSPVVSNVQVTVRGNYVDVTYDLEQAEGLECMVWAMLSKDGGGTYLYDIQTVTGDARTAVFPGNGRQFTWNAYADYPDEHITAAGIRIECQLMEYTIILPGNIPLEMVLIPRGKFMMGRYPGEQDSLDREGPQHEVTLSQPFYMSKYEVTQGQYQAVIGANPSYFSGANRPVDSVSWNDAKAFITELNTHVTTTEQGLATFRLPSEAEWEYACRAGTTTRFYWGDDPYYTKIHDYAWHSNNNSPDGTKPVGGKLPNAFGLYDMVGNVFEWCEDDWHESYNGAPTDGSAWVNSPRANYRLLRGGTWITDGGSCRSARRDYQYPYYSTYSFGIRIASTL